MMIPRKRAVMMPVMLYRMIMATAVVGEAAMPLGFGDEVSGLPLVVDMSGPIFTDVLFG